MDRMFRRIQNTFGIDVQADRVLEYSTEAELRTIVPVLAGYSVLHIGAGSNLLFTRDF